MPTTLLLVDTNRIALNHLRRSIKETVRQTEVVVAYDALMAVQICTMQPINGVIASEDLPYVDGADLKHILEIYYPKMRVMLTSVDA